MKICMILEGCYPYVRGGVSSWADGYIRALPQHEFSLWLIGAFAKDKGKFKYTLPENVTEVNELFLDDALSLRARKNTHSYFTQDEAEELGKMIMCADPDWGTVFKYNNEKMRNPVAFLMSSQFLDILKVMCETTCKYAGFADVFYTIRSMFLPVMYLLSQDVPQADLYQSTAAGYGGVLGALAKWKTGKPYVLGEHGIYPREREEEILRSKWVTPNFKDMWIKMFYMFSRCSYSYADQVLSLFTRASLTQQDIGCDPKKCAVVPNGIRLENFINIPRKEPNGVIDIAAVVRFAPIKDIKTMLYAFGELVAVFPNARLHILGDTDDQEYKDECIELIKNLKIDDKVLVVGNQDVRKYLLEIDFTILSSISEGQPLSVMESLAARRPCVTTDVGCCSELLNGDDDSYGEAGICCPPMDYIAVSRAMLVLCRDDELRYNMGETGRARMLNGFAHKTMMEGYLKAYERAIEINGRNRV